uniref:Protein DETOXIFICATION n=1 Tax=Fagus sylvatica TaxID=28930 RepID=A0A2N9FNM9_FAGSY
MQLKTLTSHTSLFQNLQPSTFFNKLPPPQPPRFHIPLFPSTLSLISTKKNSRNRIVTASCISTNKELVDNNDPENENGSDIVSVSEEEVSEVKVKELGSEGIWKQMKEIVMFTGPATGLWICGPLMSLIDTAVIGQGSYIKLAALGWTRSKIY